MNILLLGRWLSVSLSVLLTVVLFGSLGGGLLWGTVYGAIGLVLSLAQFSLPERVREQASHGQTGALLGTVTLFLALQVVSLGASIGSLSASLDTVQQEVAVVSQQRSLLLRQVDQELERVETWNRYDQPSKAGDSLARISALRDELAALPMVENTNALSLVTTLSTLSGYSHAVVAGAVYVVLSVLLDACAVYFLLSPTGNTVLPAVTRTTTATVTLEEQPGLLPDEVPSQYQAILDGVCQLSVRAIMSHYRVGSRGAYAILNQLQLSGRIEKDATTNRYRLIDPV